MKKLEERKKAARKAAQAGAAGAGEGEDWEDVDEHEKEVFATTGYFDVPNSEAIISSADQAILEKMTGPQPEATEGTLADMIMAKIASGDYTKDSDKPEVAQSLDQKVLAAYKKVGTVLRAYKSGKLPKAFKIIP